MGSNEEQTQAPKFSALTIFIRGMLGGVSNVVAITSMKNNSLN
jgi:hypothetical protein